MSKLNLPEDIAERLSDLPSIAGKVNIWTCESCKKNITCVHLETGVTPFMITCPDCGGTAESQFYRVKQPHSVWYRPKTTEELKSISDKEYKGCCAKTKANVTAEDVYAMNLKHFNEGGLFRKPLIAQERKA